MEQQLSILYPSDIEQSAYRQMSDVSWHDLGMDQICDELSSQIEDRLIVKKVMTYLCPDPRVASYREDVFEDILKNPDLQEHIVDILNQVGELQEFMSMKRNMSDMDNLWTLMRRLKEIQDYISCVERLEECLSATEISSEGLLALKEYVGKVQKDCFFTELKQDISSLRLQTKKIKSITLGLNLGEYYDITNVGILSINEKPFTKSGILSGFTRKLMGGDQISKEAEWKENYSYQPITNSSRNDVDGSSTGSRALLSAANPLMGLAMTMSSVPPKTPESGIVEHLNQVTTKMLASTVKHLKDTLAKYATVNIYHISALIPEFRYYILWAKYIKNLQQEGYVFSKADPQGQEDALLSSSMKKESKVDSLVAEKEERIDVEESSGKESKADSLLAKEKRRSMLAKEVYNLKLAALAKTAPTAIIGNDLDFSQEHSLYLLTGANRGGKTTITQTIGQLFLLAQGGIYIPGQEFHFQPVDGIYTHFPADEDKTLDFGRLGEECSRFRDLFKESSRHSLLLLNESFSTTSYEEGYYIAKDAIRAMLSKGCRTIYNTHMHKLALDVDEMNASIPSPAKAVSLIVKTVDGQRSYKVEVAPAQGQSLALDIAKKYGVTFQQLMEETC